MRTLRGISRKLVTAAAEKGLTIGVAESLTGGMITSALAGVPGASLVLTGGVVCYDSRVKSQLLGVSRDVIQGPGVVSEPCAKQMAVGVKRLLGTDITVSATGLAGPGGGSRETPVGTVFLGLAWQGEPEAARLSFRGGRQAVRRKAARQALWMMLEAVGRFDVALAKPHLEI